MSRIASKDRILRFLIVLILLDGAALGGFAQAVRVPPALSGTITAIDGANVTLELADKTRKTVVLRLTTLILERDVTSLDQVKAGDALGVTSHRSGADMVASSINIFAEEMRSAVRMDEFLMASGDTMTNGTVSGYVKAMDGHRLTMTYPRGKSTIVVPDGIPIHRLVAVKRAVLTAGMQILARGTTGPDGTLSASSISFDGPVKG